MPKEIRNKWKIIVGIFSVTILVITAITGGIIAVTEVGVQNEKALTICNWSENYGAVSKLLKLGNDLYVGSSNGVYKIKNGTDNMKKMDKPEKIMGISNYISSLAVTADGTIYAGTFGNGLYKYLSHENIFENVSGVGSEVNALVTISNILYVGTRTADCEGNLFMIDNEKIHPIDSYKKNYGEIWSLAFIDHDLYIGTKAGQFIGNLCLLTRLGEVTLMSRLWDQDNGEIYALVTKDKKMYIGSRIAVNKSRLFKFDHTGGGTITESIGWNRTTNYGEIWSLAIETNDLYIGSRIKIINNKMFRGKLYKSSNNSNSFTEVSGWFEEYGAVTSLLNVDHGLYIGSKNYNDKNKENYEGKLFFKKIK